MPASKIQDEQEVIRWFEEGRTYQWMSEQYLKKYNIETVPSMWSNFRNRRGLDPRIARDSGLIPWKVKAEHQFAYPVAMLRLEARVRAGFKLRDSDAARLQSWRESLDENNAVVHYDPDTDEGFHYIPRGGPDDDITDDDIIRDPKTMPKGGKAAGD
ncbi:hypothetical protein JNUCC0626_40070 [Lentzea sp. JNUCC 0626]|uniref:hypothetical protein n=1 Tax=Lentzea sp. JNUCC 0626 TaxID=3367513 RepID=UPI003749E49F